ncbi:SET domain-containing protein [Exidia glandulosa HHB12029]|uniref:SET domain-containing protein n=1 Tax=Exidia glandulosa HHB12029 TaxID=1314781 RepID=A0A165J1C8_EXIGL|nr:SET domain-containing protein [Exidia glandulosa HHB12029]
MSNSKQSETGAQNQMSPAAMAALEKAFMAMLSSLDGSPAPPQAATTSTSSGGKSATTSKTQTTSKLEVGLLRASDIAFPSGNNYYDHSPNAPFKLDEEELQGYTPPAAVVDWRNRPLSDADVDAFTRRSKMQSKAMPPSNDPRGTPFCIMSFGADNGSSTAVFCDPPTRQLLRAHPLHLAPLHVEPHHSAIPIYVAASPTGLGLFAARRIEAGECIFREPPLLVVTQGLSSGVAMQFDDLIEKAMPPRIRAAFDALTNCWPTEPGGRGARLGKMRTNAMGVFLSTTRSMENPFGACFQLISRANHSCAPNVNFDWEFTTFQGSLVAKKQIEAGEEILLCYVDPKASKRARREEILRKYRFKCTCKKCGPN